MSTIERRLQDMREHLRRELASDVALLSRDVEDRGEDTTVSQHPADVASDLYAREELVAEEMAIQGELEQIEDALRRLGEGRYGMCVDCDRPIASERLGARPQATRCISCQRKVER